MVTFLTLLLGLVAESDFKKVPTSSLVGENQFCRASSVPYYGFSLITTKNVPGTGQGSGKVELTFIEDSPFGVSVTDDGSYQYGLNISLDKINIRGRGELVAWVTTRDLSEIHRLGTFGENQTIQGSVDWNKFLVVITLEPDPGELTQKWRGPVVLRGMSRSGMMHTMVGHGVLQEENCFAYGYGG